MKSRTLNRLSDPGAPLFLFFKCLLIHFEKERERERDNEQGRGREKERESQAGSMLSAQNLMQGSIPQTVRP